MRNDALGLFWEDKPVIKVKKEVIKRTPPEPHWLEDGNLPHYEEALAFNVELYNETQLLMASQVGEPLVYDIESYPNYFSCAFRGVNSRRVLYFEIKGFDNNMSPYEENKLDWILKHFVTIGFNSNNYDNTMATLAIGGCSALQLHRASKMLVEQNFRPHEVLREFRVKALKGINHIDLIEVAPLSGSLKAYGGRAHTKRMQDLPYAPETELTEPQMLVVLWYNINDLDLTLDLYNELTEERELRDELSREYKLDLRSKSDAQIAEAIIGKEVRRLNGTWPKKAFIEPGSVYYYLPPAYMQFQTPLLNWTFQQFTHTPLVVGDNGKIMVPPNFKDFVITIGQNSYKLGIGGIHSQEEQVSFWSNATHTIREIDVTSFYPFIIINLCIFPKHLGRAFLTVFESIVKRRLQAKSNGWKRISDTLKIVINGTFGKLGNLFSIFYEPDLLVRVTFTGQLTLLMLIEAFELNGIPVASANTDGILVNCPNDKTDLMRQLVRSWEAHTGYNMEENIYRSVHKRDVNNYIGVKEQGKEPTLKGIFTEPGLSKNPANKICFDAVRAFLEQGVPVEQTIHACTDIRSFVTIRNVRGGAVRLYTDERRNEFLGKVVRWYYSKNCEGELVYAASGNKVPRSDGANPLMDLPTGLPQDLDYDWYIAESYAILEGVGYPIPQTSPDSAENA